MDNLDYKIHTCILQLKSQPKITTFELMSYTSVLSWLSFKKFYYLGFIIRIIDLKACGCVIRRYKHIKLCIICTAFQRGVVTPDGTAQGPHVQLKSNGPKTDPCGTPLANLVFGEMVIYTYIIFFLDAMRQTFALLTVGMAVSVL